MMKTANSIITLLLFILPFSGFSESKEIPFTMDDRDRLVRTEQKLEALDAKIDTKVDGLRMEMNTRLDSLDKRFDQLFNYLWAIIGIFTAMFVSILGFAFWDRKISMDPIKRENRLILGVIREYADSQPRLREILKNAGLL